MPSIAEIARDNFVPGGAVSDEKEIKKGVGRGFMFLDE